MHWPTFSGLMGGVNRKSFYFFSEHSMSVFSRRKGAHTVDKEVSYLDPHTIQPKLDAELLNSDLKVSDEGSSHFAVMPYTECELPLNLLILYSPLRIEVDNRFYSRLPLLLLISLVSLL